MEANEQRSSHQEIVIFGNIITVERENKYHGSEFHNRNEGSTKRKYNKSESPRFRWTNELHDCFILAVEQLGGPEKASPKPVINLMDIEGLTHSQVKSHLQMYRKATKFGKNNQGVGNPLLERENISSYYYPISCSQSKVDQRTFFNNNLGTVDYQGPLVLPHLGCSDHHPQMSIESDLLSHSTRWDSVRGKETRDRDPMLVQGSFLMPHSRILMTSCLPQETCSTMETCQYARNRGSTIETCQDTTNRASYNELGQRIQLEKPTYKLPELKPAGLLLEDVEESQVISSDKFEKEEEEIGSSLSLSLFSKTEYKKQKGCQKFTTVTDDQTPSVLGLTL